MRPMKAFCLEVAARKIAYVDKHDIKMLAKFHDSFVNHPKLGHSFPSTN